MRWECHVAGNDVVGKDNLFSIDHFESSTDCLTEVKVITESFPPPALWTLNIISRSTREGGIDSRSMS